MCAEDSKKAKVKKALRLLQDELSTMEFALDMRPELMTLHGSRNLYLLEQPEVFEEIARRARDSEAAKQGLGDYLAAEIAGEVASQDQPTVFIESGTTFVPASAKLFERHFESIPKDSILTNNLLTLTSLGTDKVRVTEGYLEVKYLAFLDFARGRRGSESASSHEPAACPAVHSDAGDGGSVPAHERADDALLEPRPSLAELKPNRVSEDDRERDIRAFRRLEEKVSEAQTIYMTSSDFGFLIGPLVGGRANAIFKYCLLNNQGRRKIRFCISYEKLFIGPEMAVECKEHVATKCYTVMNLGQVPPDMYLQFVPDYDALSNPSTRDRACSAPDELGLEEVSGWCEGHGVRGLYSSWLDLVRHTPPGSVEIVVGLGGGEGASTAQRYETLEAAREECNEVLRKLGIRRAYRAAVPEERDDVVLVRIEYA